MAVLAAVQGAMAVDKGVKKWVPGGWKTVSIIVVVSLIAIPLAIMQFLIAGIKINGVEVICEANVTGAPSFESGLDDDRDGGNDPNAPGRSVPFPTEDSEKLMWPVKGAVMTSPWGPRGSIVTGAGVTAGFHNGQDMSAPIGTPIVAPADGIVSQANNATGSQYGSNLAIKHKINGKNYTSVYHHIIGSSIAPKVGDTVSAGQKVAAVGNEGMSTGPHLHFTIAAGEYSYLLSEPGPGNTINAYTFLESNGAETAAGGLTGDDFGGGVTEGGSECASGTQNGLEGDGTTPWGAYKNGEFDSSVLKTFSGSHKLFSAAATDFERMEADYKAETGKTFSVKTAYLSKGVQQSRYDEGVQLERAGESIFGWARAVELRGLTFTSAEYKWLSQNGLNYGWHQPTAYMDGGSSANPGIWSYKGGGEESGLPPATNQTAAANRQLAKKIINENYPLWGGSEHACLVKLWEHESNWNHKAENPSSGAYGIVQALPPDKMNSVAGDWRTNPETQIIWGLEYIEGRYSTPCGAWDFWQETDPAKKSGYPGNWY